MSSKHGKGVCADHLVCWSGWGCSQSSSLLFALLCCLDQHIPSLEGGHWSRRWWAGCGWLMEECVVADLCLVCSSSWSLWSLSLERRPWWQGTHCLPPISQPPQQGWCFGRGWQFLPFVSLLCCARRPWTLSGWSNEHLSGGFPERRWCSTPSLFRNFCSSGFFFWSPSAWSWPWLRTTSQQKVKPFGFSVLHTFHLIRIRFDVGME